MYNHIKLYIIEIKHKRTCCYSTIISISGWVCGCCDMTQHREESSYWKVDYFFIRILNTPQLMHKNNTVYLFLVTINIVIHHKISSYKFCEYHVLLYHI